MIRQRIVSLAHRAVAPRPYVDGRQRRRDATIGAIAVIISFVAIEIVEVLSLDHAIERASGGMLRVAHWPVFAGAVFFLFYGFTRRWVAIGGLVALLTVVPVLFVLSLLVVLVFFFD